MAVEHHSGMVDESAVRTETVETQNRDGHHHGRVRVIFLTMLMFLELGVAGVLLAAMGTGLLGAAMAAGGDQTPQAQTVPDDPRIVPDQLRPPPMYSTKPGLNIDIPADRTIYPPDLIPPQFAWRDDSPAMVWRIEIVFGEGFKPVKVWSNGERIQLGPLDESLIGYVPPTLTPEQAAAHTWRPDPILWEEIKKHSVSAPATVIVSGFASKRDKQPLSQARAAIQTSKDPVGAPLFFRDVPLLPAPEDVHQRGVIKPLPDSALPKVKWLLRYVNERQSKTMMTGLPICGNCHSFSGDGKTLGIDVDGPANDKGFYALAPLKKVTTISDDYLVHWAPYSEEHSQKRLGFMSQVSPDGKYVVNSISVPRKPGTPAQERLYNGFFTFYGFNQVFYPTRGVLAWYSREADKLQPLPGADDPNFVQTSAFWSPDGKYLIFSRAAASDPYPPGYTRSAYAGDPNETQIKYDLYKIPFNGGKGGTAERVIGASENGMSNNFPKVSPDGKWIVFVECKNGLLMRPDSKLYIVPFEGGEARPLESNLPMMNSWHTFSPNGKWLAFSSKSPSFYTQLYLTYIDDQGHASPPVVIENATASNRAANIPEFVNIGPDGLDHIETPAIDVYREFDQAQQLQDKQSWVAAIPAWKIAIAKHPTDARPHNLMGVALAALGNNSEAIAEYNKSLELNPDSSRTHNNLGSALADEGRFDEALVQIRKAVELNPDGGVEHINLGHLLGVTGHRQEAIEELKKGIELAPKNSDGHNLYGVVLAQEGKLDEAIGQLQKAIDLAPRSSDGHFNLGQALSASGRFPEALNQFESAASLAKNGDPAILQMLAATYAKTGNYQKAIATAEQALELAVHQRKDDLAATLRGNITLYETQVRQAAVPDAAQQP
jgi:Flp pilus assembly protein TadD